MANEVSATKQIAAFDPDRLPLALKATGTKNQRTMRITAIALVAVGAAGTLASIASIVAGAMGTSLGILPASALVGVGIGGLAASVAAISTGIFLLKKSYWQDQNFVDEQSLRAMNMTFDDLVGTFGWERISKQHLISNKALKKKFFTQIERLDYSTVMQAYGQQLRDQQFVSFKELRPKLMAEAKEMTAALFKEKYSSQPLIDGVVDASDDFFCNMMQSGIKRLPYHKIARDFAAERMNGVLSNEFIASTLKAQMEGQSFYTFFKEQGGTLCWNILHDDILPPELFREQIRAEIRQEKLSVAQILERYGWDVFGLKLLQGAEFREQFLQEAKGQSLSRIIQRYSWRVLEMQMASSSDLSPLAVKECQAIPTFAQILETFGPVVFEKQILSASDAVIRERLKALYEKMPFCEMTDRFGHVLIPNALLPKSPAINQLLQEKRISDDTFAQKKLDAETSYRQSEGAADRARSSAIESSQRNLNAAHHAVERERTNHQNNLARINGQMRDRTAMHRHPQEVSALERAHEEELTRYRFQLLQLEREATRASQVHHNTTREQNELYERLVREAKTSRDNLIEMNAKLYKLEREAIDSKFKKLIIAN